MRIGYFTIDHKNKDDLLDTKWIKNQKSKKSAKFINWIELDEPLAVSIDGQNGKGEIIKPRKSLKEKMDEQQASGI